jgi:dihydropteroate synthase
MNLSRTPPPWQFRGGGVDFSRTRVMGIVNVTPDSFSDGGRFLDASAAIRHAESLVRDGADLLDVGGESTRPGSDPVSVEEELRRVVPVIREAAHLGVPVSIDTTKSAVAREAIDAGAAIVNDVTALGDPAMAGIAAGSGAGLILMHMRGAPRTMQDAPHYDDLLGEIREFLIERRALAEAAGVPRERIVLDPGIGFGKTTAHNVELLHRLAELAALGSPLLVGVSRKRFIGAVTGVENPAERLAGSLAAAVAARSAGAVLIRAHDVRATREALAVADAILRQDQ